MKVFIATLVALVIGTTGTPALAYVVVVTTSVPATSAGDETQLKTVVESAVKDVLAHAVAFTPTLVTLENARLLGDRIYLVLLIADADGEKSLEALSALQPPREEPADVPAAAGPRFTF